MNSINTGGKMPALFPFLKRYPFYTFFTVLLLVPISLLIVMQIQFWSAKPPEPVRVTYFLPENAIRLSGVEVDIPLSLPLAFSEWKDLCEKKEYVSKPLYLIRERPISKNDSRLFVEISYWLFYKDGGIYKTSQSVANPFSNRVDEEGFWTFKVKIEKDVLLFSPVLDSWIAVSTFVIMIGLCFLLSSTLTSWRRHVLFDREQAKSTSPSP